MIELRLPNITATTEREQLLQIKSYLNQLVPQLEWAMSNVSTPSVAVATMERKTSSATSTTMNAEATFNSLKSLIIKSADIVNAYYDEINRKLNGYYFADSDFGTFIQETEQRIEENSQGITRNFENFQKIESDVILIKDTFIDTDAYIKMGEVDDKDGIPIYGVEIGQKSTVGNEVKYDKCARFTSGKLSFFDKDVEVAWISGYKLNITHAEIKNSLTLGNFVIETDNGLTLKWVEKEE